MSFEFVCDFCKKSFQRSTQTTKEGCKGFFCSHVCYTNSRKTGRDIPCPTCGTLVYRGQAAIKAGRKFCSRNCHDISKKAVMVSKVCVGCSKQFEINVSISHRFNYCSFRCKTLYRKGKWVTCICGKKEI